MSIIGEPGGRFSSERNIPEKQAIDLMKKGASQRREVVERQAYHSPLDRSDWVFFGGLVVVTSLAVATRLYRISEPAHVA